MEIFTLILTIFIVACIVIITILNKNEPKDEKTLAYTDLIKQVADGNVKKVEMTTGSTSIKVTLKKEIDENGEIVKDGVYIDDKTDIKDDEALSPEQKEKLVKKTIIPSTQSFIELIQQKVADGNDIELIQKTPSIISQIPSYLFSLLPTIIMVALFIMLFKMQGLSDKGEVYDDTARKVKVKFDDVAGLDEGKR